MVHPSFDGPATTPRALTPTEPVPPTPRLSAALLPPGPVIADNSASLSLSALSPLSASLSPAHRDAPLSLREIGALAHALATLRPPSPEASPPRPHSPAETIPAPDLTPARAMPPDMAPYYAASYIASLPTDADGEVESRALGTLWAGGVPRGCVFNDTPWPLEFASFKIRQTDRLMYRFWISEDVPSGWFNLRPADSVCDGVVIYPRETVNVAPWYRADSGRHMRLTARSLIPEHPFGTDAPSS